MHKPSTNYLGLGALIGAAAALIASAIIIRKRRPSEYLAQSAEGAGHCIDSIQKHDQKTFEEEVATANI